MSDGAAFELREGGRMWKSLAWAGRAPLVPEKTCLVVIDMINHQLQLGNTCLSDIQSNGVDIEYYVDRIDRIVIPNLQKLIAASRAAGVTVAYMRIGARRKDFADGVQGLRDKFRRWNALEGKWGCEIDTRIAPLPGDVILMKGGSGSFANSSLDANLRNAGVTSVIYTGVATNGCVMSSALSGFDLGYDGYFVSDATATFYPVLQQQAEDMVGGVYAPIITTQDMIAEITRARVTEPVAK